MTVVAHDPIFKVRKEKKKFRSHLIAILIAFDVNVTLLFLIAPGELHTLTSPTAAALSIRTMSSLVDSESDKRR